MTTTSVRSRAPRRAVASAARARPPGPRARHRRSPSLVVFARDHAQEPAPSPTRASIQQLLAGAALIALLGARARRWSSSPGTSTCRSARCSACPPTSSATCSAPSAAPDPGWRSCSASASALLSARSTAASRPCCGSRAWSSRWPRSTSSAASTRVIVSGKQIDPTSIPDELPAHRLRATSSAFPWLAILVIVIVGIVAYAMRSFRSRPRPVRDRLQPGGRRAGRHPGRQAGLHRVRRQRRPRRPGRRACSSPSSPPSTSTRGHRLRAAGRRGGRGRRRRDLRRQRHRGRGRARRPAAEHHQPGAGRRQGLGVLEPGHRRCAAAAAIAFDRFVALRVARSPPNGWGCAGWQLTPVSISPAPPERRRRAGLVRWETCLFALLIATVVFGTAELAALLHHDQPVLHRTSTSARSRSWRCR